MSRMQEIIERESENQRLSQELRVANDRLNEAISMCARAGISVEVEVIPVADQQDKHIRNVVEVRPFVLVRY